MRQAREFNRGLTSEVPATLLYFSSDDIEGRDTRFKSNCVIRNRSNHALIWDILKFKGIDTISSQHASIESDFKQSSYTHALNGINCMGFSLQAVWTSLRKTVTKKEQLEHYLVRISKWMSLNPAMTIQCASERGSIEKGKLADLVIWKPYETRKVDNILSENPEMNPFFGHLLDGRICRVYLRGLLAFNDGAFRAHGRKIVRL